MLGLFTYYYYYVFCWTSEDTFFNIGGYPAVYSFETSFLGGIEVDGSCLVL